MLCPFNVIFSVIKIKRYFFCCTAATECEINPVGETSVNAIMNYVMFCYVDGNDILYFRFCF